MDQKIVEDIIANGVRIDALEKRVEACEETTKALNQLTQSIVKMDATLENTNAEVKELKTDVSDLKGEPNRRWDAVINTLISTGVGGIIGAVIAYLL